MSEEKKYFRPENKNKHFISLKQSEGIVVQVAGQIYAAYIQSGKIANGDQAEWISRSIEEAIQLAKSVDDLVVSDNEMD